MELTQTMPESMEDLAAVLVVVLLLVALVRQAREVTGEPPTHLTQVPVVVALGAQDQIIAGLTAALAGPGRPVQLQELQLRALAAVVVALRWAALLVREVLAAAAQVQPATAVQRQHQERQTLAAVAVEAQTLRTIQARRAL